MDQDQRRAKTASPNPRVEDFLFKNESPADARPVSNPKSSNSARQDVLRIQHAVDGVCFDVMRCCCCCCIDSTRPDRVILVVNNACGGRVATHWAESAWKTSDRLHFVALAEPREKATRLHAPILRILRGTTAFLAGTTRCFSMI